MVLLCQLVLAARANLSHLRELKGKETARHQPLHMSLEEARHMVKMLF